MKKLLLLFLIASYFCYGQWTQIGLDINGQGADNNLGWSVSLNKVGTILAVGAIGQGAISGYVRVYENIGGVWTQIGADINGEAVGDFSGFSINLNADGNVLAISAPGNSENGTEAGHVRVFENIAGTWTQIGVDIDGEAEGDRSGWSISLSDDGKVLAIGANENDGNGFLSGHVRIFKNISEVWTQIGSDLDGEVSRDRSGQSVSLSSDGGIVAMGATGGNDFKGHVRIFENFGNTWIQKGIEIEGDGGQFGYSVSLNDDGNIVAIGAIQIDANGSGSFTGQVRVFEYVTDTWIQIGSAINGEAGFNNFGNSLSLSGDGTILAVGANSFDGIGNGNNSGNDFGHTRIYRNVSGNWTQIGDDIVGEAIGDGLGKAVSLSDDGTVLAVGAIGNDGNGNDSGHVRVYNNDAVLSVEFNDFVLSQFNLYPNPVNEQFIIQLNEGLQLEEVNIYNNLGQFVRSTTKTTIKTFDLSQGIYFVQIVTNKGRASKKIIVE